MAWSDEAFCARVKARCAELGRSVRSVLMEAKLTLDLLEKTPSSGRRIDTLEKLCAPLQWNLQEIMGFTVSIRVSPELMAKAVKIVRRALRHVPSSDEDEAFALSVAYNAILDHQDGGGQIDDNALAMLEASIAAHFGFARRKE